MLKREDLEPRAGNDADNIVTIIPRQFSTNPQTKNLRHLFDGEPAEKQLGPRGVRSCLINNHGLLLASYFWPADGKPKGVLLFVHGHGAYQLEELLISEAPGKPLRYEGSWAQALNRAGWSVCGIDNQGCGFSEGRHGLRCYVDKYEDYVEDIVLFYTSLSACPTPGFAGLPTFIGGMSLGGCLAISAMLHKDTDFRGVIMLAPMLSLERATQQGLNKYLMHVLKLLSSWWPSLRIVATAKNPLYPDLQAIWDSDPLAWHGPTRARNAMEYVTVTRKVCQDMPTYTFPFIVFHGEDDTLTDPAGSQKLYNEAASADKTLRLIPKRWHVVMKEPGNEKILQEILEWMEARLPPASS